MRELDEAYDGTGKAVHSPNNDSEIRANINILQKTVFMRIAVLAVLFIVSTILCITENNDTSFMSSIISAIGNRGYSLVHLILGAAAIGVSFPTVANGIKYLCINRADSDSMAAVPVVAATLGAAVTAILPQSIERNEAHMFVPVAIFILLMNALGKQLILRRAVNSFSVISGRETRFFRPTALPAFCAWGSRSLPQISRSAMPLCTSASVVCSTVTPSMPRFFSAFLQFISIMKEDPRPDPQKQTIFLMFSIV
jgi:hypothetical protein